ncbi:MAG: FkbM family methyltransferase [Dolichospermum sp. WA123]|jgi:FkbM family methyltransferase|nr:FkbM family methyltransferase [Dolichospermum sp. WA123]
MARKIFIDVGGHYGETVEPVLDPIFGFDLIFSFEPVKECCEKIREIKDRRLKVIEAGLSNKSFSGKIFNPQHVGASIYTDIEIPSKNNDDFQICEFIQASSFFKENIAEGDEVYLKFNCEGSECDVIENLVASGELTKVKACLIDFDVRKIPSQRHRQQEILDLLTANNFKNFYLSEDVMFGPSNYVAIRRWLKSIGASELSVKSIASSLLHHLDNMFSGRYTNYYKWQVVRILPKEIMAFYYKNIKK